MAFLYPLLNGTTMVSYRLSTEILDALDAVKVQAEALGFAVDVTDQVERAIVATTVQLKAELAEHNRPPVFTLQGVTDPTPNASWPLSLRA
jgi:hypothetical protein